VVTAQKLLAEAVVQRVLILDCDMHYGDGTDRILERLGVRESVTDTSFGRWFHRPPHAGAYLQRLRETAARFDSYDLVLHQAGADVHVDVYGLADFITDSGKAITTCTSSETSRHEGLSASQDNRRTQRSGRAICQSFR
jgi:hypothetical protein